MGSTVLVTEPDARLIRFNSACEEVSGYGQDELFGKALLDLPLVSDDLEGWETTLRELEPGRYAGPPGAASRGSSSGHSVVFRAPRAKQPTSSHRGSTSPRASRLVRPSKKASDDTGSWWRICTKDCG